MVFKLQTELIWAVLVEMIESGQMNSLPCSEQNVPTVGDVICYESNAEVGSPIGAHWVYVRVTGVFLYYQKNSHSAIDGLRLVTFDVVHDLSSISVS